MRGTGGDTSRIRVVYEPRTTTSLVYKARSRTSLVRFPKAISYTSRIRGSYGV